MKQTQKTTVVKSTTEKAQPKVEMISFSELSTVFGGVRRTVRANVD